MTRPNGRPRIEDVASAAGVSIATVSYVFNERGNISPATAERVRQAAQRLGYQPSAIGRGLALQRANAVGILLPRATSGADPWFSLFLAGITETCQSTQYQLVLLAPDPNPSKSAQNLLDAVNARRIDGIILLEAEDDDPRVETLHQEKIPFVLFGRSNRPISWIDVDDFVGGQLATQHLLNLGHRSIGHIAAPDQYIYGRLRKEGYLEVLKQAKGNLQPILESGDLTAESGYRATHHLLTSVHRPTAIFAASDVMARGVLQCAKDLGLNVPHQLSVIGYDGIPAAWQTFPSLTTIGHSAHDSGKRIAGLLLDRIKAENPQHYIIVPHLIPGSSTAPREMDSTPFVSLESPRLKSGASFSLVSRDGWMEDAAHGIYSGDMRMFHQFQGYCDEKPLKGILLEESNRTLKFLYSFTKEHTTLRLERTLSLSDGHWNEKWHWHQFGTPRSWSLALESASDFRDMFEIRGIPRVRRGQEDIEETQSGYISSYHGLDGIIRTIQVNFNPVPASDDHFTHTWHIPDDRADGTIEIDLHWTNPVIQPDLRTEAIRRNPRVTTGNVEWNRVLARSLDDIRMLETDFGNGPVLMAGLPWFATFFGRDAIIGAYQALVLDPELAKNTLRTLAHFQGTQDDPPHEEGPGKMVHEVRLSEMAATGEVPFRRYYGSVDVTPLFLWLLAETWQRTGDETLLQELLPVAEHALDWLDGTGRDERGLYTFAPQNGQGLQVQSWKDSGDSMIFRDGRKAEPPLAVAEVQGYVYAAKLGMAQLYHHLGHEPKSRQLRTEAKELKDRFEQHFWMESRQYYGMALDGQGNALDVISSDPGQCLWTGIIPVHRIDPVIDRLKSPPLFSGWGIRTLASSERAYDPYSYHRGSVWPHDTSLIVAGLIRAQAHEVAIQVAEGLMAAASHFPYHRLPELFSGESKTAGRPIPYTQACAPQAWAAGAPILIAVSLLGLRIDHISHTIWLSPAIPVHVGWIRMTDIPLSEDAFLDVWSDGQSVKTNPLPAKWNLNVEYHRQIVLEETKEENL